MCYKRLFVHLLLLVAVTCLPAACTANIEAPGDPSTGPGKAAARNAPIVGSASTPAPPSGKGPEPISAAEIDSLCTADTAHPRNLLRLPASELLTTLRALAPSDFAAVPAALSGSVLGAKPDETLAISRDFHESLNTLAVELAKKVAASPGADLACASSDFGVNETCTRDFLTRASAKFYRGANTLEDVTALVALAKAVAQRSGGKTALEYAVRAMALSPKTLYLSEGMDLPPNADPRKPTPLTPAEMASFLSYRVTGRPPTDKLLTALRAAPGLTGPRLQAIIAESFSLDDLQRAGTNFFAAWLNVSDITRVTKDTQKHPRVNDAYMQALQKETYDAIVSFMKTDRADLRAALTTEQRSALTRDAQSTSIARFGRPGLFTLPGVLATISSSDHTDIPRRGRFLLKALFCDLVPSPPADLVQNLPPPPPNASERQRFEKVEMEPACVGCHVRVNRLGFALESYDEIGAARAQDERGNAIRTDSVHVVPGHGDLSFADAADLLAKSSQHPVVQNCLAVQSFRYFARREERGAEDACMLRDIAVAGRATRFQLADLFKDTLVRTALAARAN